MSLNQHSHTWNQKLMQLFPEERKKRIQNLAWLIVGIFTSRSVNLSRAESKILDTAKLTGITRRLARFLEKKAVRCGNGMNPQFIPKFCKSRIKGITRTDKRDLNLFRPKSSG